jgi:hypothetical protein
LLARIYFLTFDKELEMFDYVLLKINYLGGKKIRGRQRVCFSSSRRCKNAAAAAAAAAAASRRATLFFEKKRDATLAR